MPHVDVPQLGQILIAAIFVSACYTLALSIAASRGRTGLNRSIRAAMLTTTFFTAAAVFLLGYAFQSHDFRIRYVARYSDRSMPWYYLVTALWGGQDGSLLWWCFLLSVYTWLFVAWIRQKYAAMQPAIFGTIASVFIFFGVLMLFAANPFSTNIGAPPVDGEGLNPLLQNYWMAIHPPALYMGLVGWAIPFAICNAALVTGRLGEEWILMARRWTLLAWGFLSLGNLLGMFWSYEELGWGGYWAWDPVENAAFMPWLLGTAYLHAVMIQERRGMMKIWTASLMCGAYFFTIFGTFLTRSGLIASVHSFAKSDIGIYFVWYMGLLLAYLVALILYRLPKLRSLGTLESKLSREFAFLMNNWILVSMLVFILIATTFPLISEALRGQVVTVGPAYYNKWMVPLGLTLVMMTGIGPLIAWRKASGNSLAKAFRFPVAASLIALALHIAFGARLGFAPRVASTDIYPTFVGRTLGFLYSISPAICVPVCVFVLGSIVQEFVRGTRARMSTAQESPWVAFAEMFSRAKRRYGGYVVHLGVVILFLGFLGSAYDEEREGLLDRGETMHLSGYSLRYRGSRVETDLNKTMVFADMDLMQDGNVIARISPAKFRYRTHPEMPTTEVAIRTTALDDLYVILSTVDTTTDRATFRIIRRPLVFWVWFGGVVLLLGTFLSAFPDLKDVLGESSSKSRARNLSLTTAALFVIFVLAAIFPLLFFPRTTLAQDSSSLHAANVEMHDPHERELFSRLLCMCGDCARLPLSSCGCTVAEQMREEVRAQVAAGVSATQIERNYRERFGSASIAIPSDEGLDRAMWALPLGAAACALMGVYLVARRWQQKGAAALETRIAANDAAPTARDEMDDKVDEALRDLE